MGLRPRAGLAVALSAGELHYRAGAGRFALRFDASASGSADDARVRIEIARQDGRLGVTVIPREDLTVERLVLQRDHRLHPDDRFFLNGYQSWTDSREFGPGERIPSFPLLLGPLLRRRLHLNRYGGYDLVEQSGRNLHGFTYTYVRRGGEDAIDFIGSLSEREGFTVLHVLPDEGRLLVAKDCRGLELERDRPWRAFLLHLAKGPEERVFDEYLLRYREESGLPAPTGEPCTGWTSWYYHYTAISEELALKNLDAFARRQVPIDVFQIDDGWQGAVGDWLVVNGKFPRGLRFLVDRIHAAGYRAGLWLAPFVAERSARLLQEHPEWALRDERGRLVPAGNSTLWSGDFYGLDIFHPGLRDHLARVFDTVLGDWGFDLVKLDFLYGACLLPRPDRTRGEIMTCGMELLRRLCGSKQIIGCGVPLGAAFGRVDYCRIGPDVGPEWRTTVTRGTHLREGISTLTALENAIGRRQLSGRAFLNDPDVFILRELSFDRDPPDLFTRIQELRHGRRRPLSAGERHTLLLLNHVLGELVFTSDDLDEYDERELELYLSSFPPRRKQDLRVRLMGPAPTFGGAGGAYELRFRIGPLRYTVLANLADTPERTVLASNAFARGAGDRGRFLSAGQELPLPPHASVCLLEDGGGEVELVGSEGSLLPGADLEELTVHGDEITLRRSAKARGAGRVFIRVPRGLPGYRVNDAFVPAVSHEGREGILVLDGAALPRL